MLFSQHIITCFSAKRATNKLIEYVGMGASKKEQCGAKKPS
jgi:hypothetical protein